MGENFLEIKDLKGQSYLEKFLFLVQEEIVLSL